MTKIGGIWYAVYYASIGMRYRVARLYAQLYASRRGKNISSARVIEMKDCIVVDAGGAGACCMIADRHYEKVGSWKKTQSQ